jgi:hypothetical protein
VIEDTLTCPFIVNLNPKASPEGIGEIEGELTDISGNKLLRFGYGEINVMITGTISKEELIKVVESMVAQKATTA